MINYDNRISDSLYPKATMKTTFYIGKNPEHKIDVSFQKNGKEIIHVDGKCVLNNWSISRKGSRAFNAGKHSISIEYVGNFYDWSCKVFVDDCLYMHELFPAELETRKIETANLGKFYKVLGIG